jgi:hypothetical protein
MDGAPSASAAAAKRGRAHDISSDLDSALDSLVTKLGATTHDDQDSLVAVLVDVLHVEPDIATFYLEASNFNPHVAVQLHMQQGVAAASGFHKRSRPPPAQPTYEPMPVFVAGLPDGWGSRVSAAGTIVFEHLATGHEQSTIPPGFHAAASSDEGADEADAWRRGRGRSMAEAPDAMAEAPATSSAHRLGSGVFAEQARASAPEADRPPLDDDDEELPAAPMAAPPSSQQGSYQYTPEPQPQVHLSVVCDGCEGPVVGHRFQCLTRSHFDLCEACMWSAEGAKWRVGHRFMKMSFVGA